MSISSVYFEKNRRLTCCENCGSSSLTKSLCPSLCPECDIKELKASISSINRKLKLPLEKTQIASYIKERADLQSDLDEYKKRGF